MSTSESNDEIIAPEKVLLKGRVKGTGKKKINIKLIERKQQIFVSFTKRRNGLKKKADKFSSIMGFKFVTIVFSPTGRLNTHGNPSFDEVFGNYLKMIEEKKVKKNLKGEDNELVKWLQGIIQLEEYDDVEELVILKEKLLEIKEKVRMKITRH